MPNLTISPILRFGLPIGTAFIIFGIHEIVPFSEGVVELFFGILELFGIHQKHGTKIHCASLPSLEEDDQLVHPHEYHVNSSLSLVEVIAHSSITVTSILLYWIGFIFKGSKICLLSWIILYLITSGLRIRYFLYGEEPNEENPVSPALAYSWAAFQVTMTCIRYLYMTTLSILYLRFCYSNSEELVQDDLKPVGIGVKGLFKYFSNNLRYCILALGISALLDVMFVYITDSPSSMLTKKDTAEALMIFICIEAIPYLLLILVFNLKSSKWVEYWRSGFLAVCFLWVVVLAVVFAVVFVFCSAGYYLNPDNLFNTLLLVYVFVYKCFIHRISLFYVKKMRNTAPIEMSEMHANGTTMDPVNDSRAPFVNFYDY